MRMGMIVVFAVGLSVVLIVIRCVKKKPPSKDDSDDECEDPPSCYQPEDIDICRAALCCLALNEAQSGLGAVRILFSDTRCRRLDFKRVIISPEDQDQKFLLATTTNETLYVAFAAGSRWGNLCTNYPPMKLQDFAQVDERCQGLVWFGGEHHEFLPPGHRIYDFGRETISKENAMQQSDPSQIVFCGHSMGGVFSQMSLFKFLLQQQQRKGSSQPGFESIRATSITFGSPMFCDLQGSKSIRRHFPDFVERVFNKCNPGDVALHKFIGDFLVARNRLGVTAVSELVEHLNVLGQASNSSAAHFNHDMFGTHQRLVRKHFHGKHFWSSVRVACAFENFHREFLKILSPFHSFNFFNLICPKLQKLNFLQYLGNYFNFLRCKFNCFGFGTRLTGRPQEPREIQSSGSYQRVPISDTKLNNQARIEAHDMKTSFDAALRNLAPNISKSHSEAPVVVEGVPPEIEKASLVIIQGRSANIQDARITVYGKFLSPIIDERCTVKDCASRWEIKPSLDPGSLLFETNGNLKEWEIDDLRKVSDRGATSVNIATAFGLSGYKPVHFLDFESESYAVAVLKRAVGKLLLLEDASGPNAEVGREIREKLKDVTTKCNPEPLIPIPEERKSIHDRMKSSNDTFVKEIIRSLCANPIYPEKTVNQNAETCSPGTLLFLEGTESGTRLDTYPRILEWLHHVAIENGDVDDGVPRTIGQMEKTLHNKVLAAKSVAEFQMSSGSFRKDMIFLTKETLRVTSDRIKLLHAVMSIEVAANRDKVIAVIGPENAGKSSLVNHLSRKGKAETGFRMHTSDVKAYHLEDHLVVVDFPGTGAPQDRKVFGKMWKTFPHLADLCVVVLPFEGDVNRNAEELPRLAKEIISPNVILLVNRMDSVLKGPSQSSVWNEYSLARMEQLKQAFLETSGVRSVILSVLEDEGIFPHDRKELTRRKIMFPQDVVRVLRQTLKSL